ncbi:MAG: AraC family transcriptional regulator [Gemmiger sp.]|nr:AraC family transcriptional regulator [Gemmiger sp.]
MSCKRYDITMDVAPREAVKLIYISKSRFGGDWHSILHTHKCAELFYCVNGCGQFNIGGTLHGVSQDDLVIINPMVEHTELSLNSNPLEYVVLGVEGIDFLFDKGNERFSQMNCGATREEMLFLFRSLLREVDGRGEACETICQDLLEVLLLWLVRDNAFTVRPNTMPGGSKECAAAKRYLDEHYTENLSLNDLAATTHVNKYYLSHEFSREYNISPINYLIRKRIEESKSLLASTNYSISEISNMLGFSSASYFSQSFRRLADMTPAQYRKSAQG